MGKGKFRFVRIASALLVLAPLPAFSQSAEDLFRLGVQVLPLIINPQTPPPGQQRSTRPERRGGSERRASPRYDDAQVAETQRLLNALGYSAGPDDGRMGPRTRAAIGAFQRDFGLPVTERPDPALLAVLRAQQRDPRAVAGPVPASPPFSGAAGFKMLDGFDLPYSDYRSGIDDPRLSGISEAECRAQCASDQRCRAFTFNANARVCILKDGVPQPRAFAGAVSGIKVAGNSDPLRRPPGPASGSQPGYADFVRLALLADPESYRAQREVAGVAYRLATADEAACREMMTRLPQMSRDVFAVHDFVMESAGMLDQVLASLDSAPRTLDITLTDKVTLGLYDFQAQGYAVNSSLVRGGSRRLADEQSSAPPCDLGLSLHHSLPSNAMDIVQIGLGSLSLSLAAVPAEPLLPLEPNDARAFEARNPARAVEFVAHVRVDPPEKAFGPLRGQTLSLDAIDSSTGSILYSFDLTLKQEDVSAQLSSVPPDAAAVLEGIPRWNGRLMVRGPGGVSDFVPEEAVDQFGKAAKLIVLKENPGLLQDDTNAFAYFNLLEEFERNRIAVELGIDPQKITAWGNLDEFERRALLAKIRSDLLPILTARAPALPLPVLVLCGIGIGEYDFEREAFPLQNLQECRSGYLSIYGYGEGNIGNLTITIPVPSEKLPNAIQVPLAEAKEYKQRNIDVRPSDRPFAVQRTIMGLAGQLTGLSFPQLQFQLEIEEILLFRPDDKNTPFERLQPNAPPSLATVSAEPQGAVFMNAETIALGLLARGDIDLDDPALLASWISERARIEQIGNTPWAKFFHQDVAGRLARRENAADPTLAAAFAEWTRARAQLLPETIFLEPRQDRPDGDTAKIRSFVGPNDGEALSKRLGIPEERLGVVPGVDWLNSLGDSKRVVVVLPAARDNFAVPLDPAAAAMDSIEVSVGLRIQDITIVQAGGAEPVIAIEVLPQVARLTTATDRGASEIGSHVFDVAAESISASASDHPSAVPFGAEVADLLQLRFLPATVDDREIERMMISRFAYEKEAPEPVFGGRFFPDVTQWPDAAERARLLPDFRAWSEARAETLPERLTVSLEFRNGTAQYENWGTGADQCDDIRRDASEAASPTEQQAMGLRLCDFLVAAWTAPDDILFLKNTSFSDHVSAGEGRGPRYWCGSDPYCLAIHTAREKVGLPTSERAIRLASSDLVRIDRLPVLDESMRSLDREVMLEIDVSITGASLPEHWPDTAWKTALRLAAPFAERFGLPYSNPPQEMPLPGTTVLFEAKAIAARIVDAKSGEILAEPELTSPAPLPVELLEVGESKTASLDILGIRIGTSFEEADRIIRGHMQVGRVLVADRSLQFATLSGKIDAYSSGRMYISQEETEVIVIFDEPPAAPGRVVGLWRMLRMPHGGIEPGQLKATLTERYGPPSAVEEVSPGGSTGGINFAWSDFAPQNGCQGISENHQNGLWYDAAGNLGDPPATLGQHYYPAFALSEFAFFGVDGAPLPLSSLCPRVLGVRYAIRPAQNGGTDEIVSWLKDDRAYAELYYESVSRQGELAQSNEAQKGKSGDIGIKF